ncbi:MAG: phosphate ABC transporter substrate-binding protein PstS family protein [bacterium]|nr:phosphate ABC transporter substrate-binding protein PstS family protein [bacterium]
MLKARILTLVAVVLLTVAALGGVVAAQDGTIVDIAAGDENFSTLVSLVQAAGLADVLAGEGPFTVFAPTNEAFAELPQFVVDYLGANPELLTRVLTYHVVSGAVTSDQITESMMADSMEMGAVGADMMGSQLNIQVTEEGIKVDNANVVTPDITASNGVIHVIDEVLIPPIELPEVDVLSVQPDAIIVAGSSTVFPVARRLADLFVGEGFSGDLPVESIGSGAGLERFCVNAETDIATASRPINEEETEACLANGRTPAEFYIGIDALVIAVSTENDFVDSLTIEQLAQVFTGAGATWADINPDWPAEPIQIFSPGSDSGTYDYFVEEIFDEDETFIQNSGAQFSEDDNVLVQGVESSPFAIGYFGFAYYQENQDRLRAIPVEGITPSEETGTTGEYPLSRPLFIYSAPEVMQEKPQVAAFINFFLNNVADQLGTGADQIGYIPTNEYIQRRDALTWLAATNFDLSQ